VEGHHPEIQKSRYFHNRLIDVDEVFHVDANVGIWALMVVQKNLDKSVLENYFQ